ncbi:ribonuclease H-like domain-containing protein [Candidatus Uhrbacteria bacterium]|nr:ribonuclease H-like domain-containing protein [Candidatus Uhrbacteria bacterium]
MPKEVVLDIETQNTYQDLGVRDHRQLKVSLVGIYASDRDEYQSFLEPELPRLWPILEQADRVIGYNIKHFDLPVLANYYPGDLSRLPCLDILEEIERKIGFRIKLDDLARATLGRGKSGNGLQAVEFWRKGELEKLRAYCLQDVRVTKEVYEHGLAAGQVVYMDRLGRRNEIPVDFSLKTNRRALNLTMGL